MELSATDLIEPFNFIPPNGLEDVEYFPTVPGTESEARKQIQTPLNQLKDHVNKITEKVNVRNEFDNSSNYRWYFKDGQTGMIRQGGYVDINFNYTDVASVDFSFVKPFPNKVYSLVANEKNNNITTRGMFNICAYENGLTGATCQAVVLNLTPRTGKVTVYWEATGY